MRLLNEGVCVTDHLVGSAMPISVSLSGLSQQICVWQHVFLAAYVLEKANSLEQFDQLASSARVLHWVILNSVLHSLLIELPQYVIGLLTAGPSREPQWYWLEASSQSQISRHVVAVPMHTLRCASEPVIQPAAALFLTFDDQGVGSDSSGKALTHVAMLISNMFA